MGLNCLRYFKWISEVCMQPSWIHQNGLYTASHLFKNFVTWTKVILRLKDLKDKDIRNRCEKFRIINSTIYLTKEFISSQAAEPWYPRNLFGTAHLEMKFLEQPILTSLWNAQKILQFYVMHLFLRCILNK